MYADRKELSQAIVARIRELEPSLTSFWKSSSPVRHFFVDNLLEPEWVRRLANSYPASDSMLMRSSVRERKRVGIHLDSYDAIVRDALMAFQEPNVVELVSRITGHEGAVADPTLYASGVSVMSAGDFLNPHIDNSHDGDCTRYRVLNLLDHVSPDWSLANGGNLELWDPKVRTPHVIESKFNRLVVMETHQTSWHSVNSVRVPKDWRCVSNYYFSERPVGGRPYFNVTTFTGRPEEPLRRMYLKVMDGVLLNTIGKTFPALTRLTKHRLRAPTK